MNIIEWFIALVKYPFIFNEHFKLLKEVNEKLDSPSRFKDNLEFIDKAYEIKIKLLAEEKERLALSDSAKEKKIGSLIDELKQAKQGIGILINQMEKTIKEREDLREKLRERHRASMALANMLNERLQKDKLGSLEDAFQQALQGRLLGEKRPFNKYSPFLKPDKKE